VTDGGLEMSAIGELGGLFAIIGIVIAVVAILTILGLVVLPLLFVLVDVVVVVIVGVGLVAFRVAFRRPWTIEAVDPSGNSTEWKVVGWRASRDLKAKVRQRITSGLPLPSRTLHPARPPDHLTELSH